MKGFVFVLTFLFTLGTFGQGGDLLNSLKGKKVIYVWGGWPGHKPKESVDFFVPWLKSEGAIVTVSNSLDIYTDKEIKDFLSKDYKKFHKQIVHLDKKITLE